MTEDGLAVVERAFGQHVLIAAVSANLPQIVAAISIAEKYDGLAVRRPLRLARIVEDVGDALGRATRDRQDPYVPCRSIASILPSGETETCMEVP